MILARESFEWANDSSDLMGRSWTMFPPNGDDGYYASYGTHPGDFPMNPTYWPTVSTAQARTGSRCFSVYATDGLSNGGGKILPSSSNHMFVAFGAWVTAGATMRMELLSPAPGLPLRQAKASITIGAIDGSVTFINLWGDGQTTAPGVVRFNEWNHFQLEYDRHLGYLNPVHYRLKVNGVLLLDIYNLSNGTAYDQVSIIGFWAIAPYVSGGFFPPIYVDDLVVNDASTAYNTSWPGEVGVYYVPPAADGHYQQFDPAGLAHFSRVNEHPNDRDVSYTSATGAGPLTDSYTMTPIAMPGGGSILDIATVVVDRKTDAGTRVEDGLVRIASTDYPSSTPQPILAGYAVTEHAWPVDPATSAAWTAASVNAAEFGTAVT